MTRIDFYSNAASRPLVACQLTTKAFAQGLHVLIFAPDDAIARAIDRQLWTFQATGFVPHCMAGERLAGETPVLISASIGEAGHDGLLVNLSDACPPLFARFRRLIEIVGNDDQDRLAARLRWRFYRERGYEVNHVELGKS
ncbi:MAG: DNA polymerase III subunit chi [Betaproteobacteria bacterium RIFCSPLOWO2_02_FULL_65_24]|nr:MAG: DNA polymerase III subunit chi [Betaproteobacteria bacterium RIFCSPLOWO2_02_FULL_65_24]OGA36619.1 MAG: DNA polymerase III subunit chi [Betaproteobacteria bacterium RIFCSPLOWO2_12_FULL_62_13b]